ncbi:MAG TPA: ATP synthase subunit I [Deltaproteobacteria bacterium]|nr:ATP synthase subunit I [Deltaproteobacteria bacterium]
MNDLSIITIALLASAFAGGLALGALYILALWKTVNKLPDSSHPVRLMLGSFALRISVLLAAFYFIMGGHWERLAMAFAGFFVMKIILTRRLGINKTASLPGGTNGNCPY